MRILPGLDPPSIAVHVERVDYQPDLSIPEFAKSSEKAASAYCDRRDLQWGESGVETVFIVRRNERVHEIKRAEEMGLSQGLAMSEMELDQEINVQNARLRGLYEAREIKRGL
jgi:hypothetical protein